MFLVCLVYASVWSLTTSHSPHEIYSIPSELSRKEETYISTSDFRSSPDSMPASVR
jgi:hypothetical protein